MGQQRCLVNSVYTVENFQSKTLPTTGFRGNLDYKLHTNFVQFFEMRSLKNWLDENQFQAETFSESKKKVKVKWPMKIAQFIFVNLFILLHPLEETKSGQ